MLDTARKSLEMLGLSEHEALIVSHKDEPQKHVHVIVNRVHPITGVAGDIRNSKRKFSDFAREYEREHGKIYCRQREVNFNRREEGEATRYHDPVIEQAWNSSRSGEGFLARLDEHGYALARGRKRVVVVDPHGKAHNPVRHLDGVDTKRFTAHLSDLELTKLPDADELQSQRTRRSAAENRKQQAAFESLATLKINTLQEKHHLEHERLSFEHARQIVAEKRRLGDQYRLREQKRDIARQSKKIQNASWWRRLFGITRRDRLHLQDQILAYKNSRWRYREQIQKLLRRNDEELSRLREVQKSEQAELKLQLHNQREAHTQAIQRQNKRGTRRTRARRMGASRER